MWNECVTFLHYKYFVDPLSLSILHDFIRSSVMRLRSFFTILSDRSNLRSQRSSEIDVSLVLAQKEEKNRPSYERFAKGKKISKKSTVQFSKVKSSGVTRRPFHPLRFAKMGKKFLAPRANGSGYRLLYAESNWNAPRNFSRTAALLKETVLRDFIGIFDKATPAKNKEQFYSVNEIQFLVERS